MISKELLSEVLGEDFEILSIGKHFVKIRHLEAYTSVEWCIHKVAHECKEWAFNNNMMFDIRWHTNVNPFRISVMTYGKDSQFFVGGTEPEAVFLATQWLLDNKEKQ